LHGTPAPKPGNGLRGFLFWCPIPTETAAAAAGRSPRAFEDERSPGVSDARDTVDVEEGVRLPRAALW
jgi:hypothetical protein